MVAGKYPSGLRPNAWELGAFALTGVSSLLFVLIEPPVSDLWAARARESAVRHGVGLDYWFSWFGGIVPGRYSLLEPYVAAGIGSTLLAAVSGLGVMASSFVLLRDAEHRSAAVFAVAAGVSCNLWSGRVAFLVGLVFAVAVLVLVRDRRAVAAGVVTVLVVALAPVCAAYLCIALVGVIALDRDRRPGAVAVVVTAAVGLGAIAVWFGSPGPEGFRGRDAVSVMIATAALLLLRPPPVIRWVVLVSIPTCLALALVPNGMGSNFQRLCWFCLPVACIATSNTPRRLVLALAPALGILLGLKVTVVDLETAADPLSQAHYYDGLAAELDRLPDVPDHRVEVVANGTHTAAFALLGHAHLAYGWETQSDNAYNAVLRSSHLDTGAYRDWLDHNAVGYVALTRTTRKPGPEDTLVRSHRPAYLTPVWADHHVTLYRVQDAVPIVDAPGRLVAAGQATVDVAVPADRPVVVRVRWAEHLDADCGTTPAHLTRSDDGWVMMRAGAAAICRLSG